MEKKQEKVLDLRNVDIVTEVNEKAGMVNDDRNEAFEIWTITTLH
ncbi:MAG: hypothetical protein ACOY3E_16010 [Pseudomonadota bacterium]